MVDYIEKSFWKCPYCEKEYDTWEDALECAEECADIDYPKEDKKTFAVCEFCKKEYEDDEEAEGCEEHHAEEQDDFFTKFQLKKAGEHPQQEKLLSVSHETKTLANANPSEDLIR